MIEVLIGRQEFERYGERQLFEYLRNSEANASYTLFHPKFRIKSFDQTTRIRAIWRSPIIQILER